jgi:hypothetical protein
MLLWLRLALACLQKFAQQLLEVADNLESAQRAVPAAVLQPGTEISTEKALGYLKALLGGVQATERVLLKVRRGLEGATLAGAGTGAQPRTRRCNVCSSYLRSSSSNSSSHVQRQRIFAHAYCFTVAEAVKGAVLPKSRLVA